jgi:ferric-dicitrate binding protein FerR (iron transport regulator)
VSHGRNPEEQALDRLIGEVRELPAHELDWDRVEARLMNEPRPASAAVPGFFGRLRLPAAALVAVATGVFLFASRHTPAPVAQLKPAAQIQNGPINGDKLALGTHVTAGNHSVVVEHVGRARWTLDPHATASVTDAGEFLTVRLEDGALSASVVPKLKPETFAVEVGGTRVAVHGTAFRVERVGDRVEVEVTEGTVAVEPTEAHSDPSFLLRRGSRGSFGLDGRTGSVEGNASVVMHDSGPKSRREIPRVVVPSSARAQASAAPATSVPAVNPEPPVVQAAPALPEQPSISDIETGVSSAVDLLNRCFRDKTQSSDIRVSVSTGMTLSVAGDGTVQSVTFGPPLAPAVEDCGVAGLRNLTFARSVEGATFTRILELKR